QDDLRDRSERCRLRRPVGVLLGRLAAAADRLARLAGRHARARRADPRDGPGLARAQRAHGRCRDRHPARRGASAQRHLRPSRLVNAAPLPLDPAAMVRSRQYRALLVLASLIGLIVSAAAWCFLEAVHQIQIWVYEDLPEHVGYHATPVWWPLPWVA